MMCKWPQNYSTQKEIKVSTMRVVEYIYITDKHAVGGDTLLTTMIHLI